MKKVCFFIPSIDAGGLETYLLRFLKFSAGKFQVTVVVRNKFHEGELYQDYQSLEVNLVFMPLGYFNLKQMLKYLQFLRKNKFHTVCDLNGNFAGLVMMLSWFAGIRNRITFYRSSSNHFKKNSVNLIYNSIVNKLVGLFSTYIFANSNAGMNFFFPDRKPNDQRFKVIYNGLDFTVIKTLQVDAHDLREELQLPADAILIAHSGRFQPPKNHEVILQVAQQVVKANAKVYFLLCGKDTEKLKSKTVEMGIAENVRLLGYRNDVLNILSISDLFFFPSITEGQPNALIEAMALGLPVVASDIDVIKECVPAEMYAKLLRPNDVMGFVQAITNTIRNRKQENLQSWVEENFSATKNFELFQRYL